MNTLVYVALLTVLGGVAVSTEQTVYYHEHIGIPAYEAMAKAEKLGAGAVPRLAGGLPAAPGQFPYMAGTMIALHVPNVGLRMSVCGASLLSNTKVLTAAHCWWDGRNQALNTTVILGSTLFFSGGVRFTTTQVEMHPLYNPEFHLHHDIAMITIPFVTYQPGLISPVALPSSSLQELTFEGYQGVVAGYGFSNISGAITSTSYLQYNQLQIISNSECQRVYGAWNVISSTICTSGVGGVGPCAGDTGGPLAVTYDGVPTLVGVATFYAFNGCNMGLPAGYTRVSSYIPWINERL